MPIITCSRCGYKTKDIKIAEKHFKQHYETTEHRTDKKRSNKRVLQ